MDTKLSGGKALAQTVGITAPGLARVARRAEGGRTAPELEVRSLEPRQCLLLAPPGLSSVGPAP